jgi:hypothetical protein
MIFGKFSSSAGSDYENRGKWVTILRKSPHRTWRITHHIRDDFPRDD